MRMQSQTFYFFLLKPAGVRREKGVVYAVGGACIYLPSQPREFRTQHIVYIPQRATSDLHYLRTRAVRGQNGNLELYIRT